LNPLASEGALESTSPLFLINELPTCITSTTPNTDPLRIGLKLETKRFGSEEVSLAQKYA